jgi:hypothetical protein
LCYSWEIALNTGLYTLFNNMQDWKGIWEKGGGVNSTKAHITKLRLPPKKEPQYSLHYIYF